MSVNATRYVWELDLTKHTKRSTKRLVLLALADRANNDGLCFPSISRVCEDTYLDRKTVMNTINDLIELGFIADTGEKKGATKQVRVLKFTNLPVDNSKSHKEISQEAVPNISNNGGKFPSNGGKFGTRNLKEPINESKNNFKSEDLKIDGKEMEDQVVSSDQVNPNKPVNPIDSNVDNTSLEACSVDSDTVKQDSDIFVPQEVKQAVSRSQGQIESVTNPNKEGWIPKHLYAQRMKEKRMLEEQNKEFFIPKSMRESFEKAGEIRKDVSKGIPMDALVKLPKWMQQRVAKHS